jgi:hypothetical protein
MYMTIYLLKIEKLKNTYYLKKSSRFVFVLFIIYSGVA